MAAVHRFMDRARLKPTPDHHSKGFTLVEAMVAMVIFTLGFSGLYFFFGAAQQVIAESEKRMYLNLMADRIIETIAAEGMRSRTDALNPFVTPTQYSGSLATCSYPATDSRQLWCNDLNANIGPLNTTTGLEMRQVDITKDSTGLIINVSLVTNGGTISSYFTRKLRQI
ncbi:prepilin-type N-terminal cleavage/methylation domain-containing protein [Polynucleobacter sp. UB-Tiil-W10]|uniref:type IV pilus modification PilV family protein n=1 Tax=Polynucleobacter sp. UB-Tiil-W10 TaxID=1855648 RepID=UPI001C0B8636|nr:prepilin-type N-terminal cleavage/methylation domain-containing protein [Polynucleobacter sp. UB-Tiil-W10]MBU3541621.1 prepilin-type N-terminal cleavage/methylation domain-containing protein [Polynucleobacter sp. UB-Tiil-W10]